jgi:hypothetical protein
MGKETAFFLVGLCKEKRREDMAFCIDMTMVRFFVHYLFKTPSSSCEALE